MNSKDTKTLATQTLAMPAHTNTNGDIFGGWLVSQMDLAGGIVTKKRAHGRITTVAIDSMVFQHPVQVGDVVSCYADIDKVGRTSMRVIIEAWVLTNNLDDKIKVSEGVFTYVAIDDNGHPRPVDAASA